MSKSKKTTSKSTENLADEQKEALAQKKRPNIIYLAVSVSITLGGIILIILSQVYSMDSLFFIALGLLGLGIMLIVQRSVYRQTTTSPTNTEPVEDEDSLSLRKR